MKHLTNRVEDIKIAYIGGGSRGWAWGLMSDLVSVDDISGTVALYDIDREAAEANVIIGNKYNEIEGAKTKWDYLLAETLEDALTGADFVIISILPGTLDEMWSDVHTPEKYGIFQSVGDTVGPGGIVRALRTIPMMQVIAEGVKKCCPEAWVINYTNPMTVSVKALYEQFPEIKCFGCCHEVFGTQKLLATALEEVKGIKDVQRDDIKINVVGINHFTWITKANYKDIDLYPVYAELVKQNFKHGEDKNADDNWANSAFSQNYSIKFDLFKRYGIIAAAGDRHLAEFCPAEWYIGTKENVESWDYKLTGVQWRKNHQAWLIEQQKKKASGEASEEVEIKLTGEDGVKQIRALLGLSDLITNVNLPNRGQISNLPLGAVVETNAVFRDNQVIPVFSGEVPVQIKSLVDRIVGEQETTARAALNRDLELAFSAFVNDPLVTVDSVRARELFDEMVENTKSYLTEYFN